MKTLVALRHPDKDTLGNVAPEGLEKLQVMCANGRFNINGGITDIFYGPVNRSLQSAAYAIAALSASRNLSPYIKIHGPIDEIGNNEIFGEIGTPEFMGARKCKADMFVCLEKLHKPEDVKRWQDATVPGLKKIFDLIQDDGLGFLPGGHTPIIPWWVNSCDALTFDDFKDRDMQVLEGRVFVLEDGKISATKIIAPPGLTELGRLMAEGPDIFKKC